MENETIEVSETPVNVMSIKEVAARAAVGALVGIAVTELATFLMRKAVARFRKPKLTLVNNTEK